MPYISPYASLEIPCDVCALRCEAKSLRQKTIESHPELDIPALEESGFDSASEADTDSTPSTPTSFKSGSPWPMINLNGPCPVTCAGVIQEAKDRQKAVDEAKKWLEMYSTDVQGRMPR